MFLFWVYDIREIKLKLHNSKASAVSCKKRKLKRKGGFLVGEVNKKLASGQKKPNMSEKDFRGYEDIGQISVYSMTSTFFYCSLFKFFDAVYIFVLCREFHNCGS